MNNYSELARRIFKPEYHDTIETWLENASKAEIKGLKLTSMVVNKQGLKKFKPIKKEGIELAMSTKNLYQHQSHYNEAFGENVTKKVYDSEVLKYVKLTTLPIARTLRPEVLMFLERWLKVEESDYYTNLTLQFIRGFFGVSHVNKSVPISTTREIYSRKKSERISKYGHKRFTENDIKIKFPEIKKSKTQGIIPMKATITKDVKDYVNRDHKDMIKWVSGTNPFKTMYQDEYYMKNLPQTVFTKKDFYVSTSVKLLPDPNTYDN